MAVHPSFNLVAMMIASADAQVHSGPVPWPSRCAINTDFLPLIDPAEDHAGHNKINAENSIGAKKELTSCKLCIFSQDCCHRI